MRCTLVDVIDEVTHECGPSRECELRVAFSERLFCQPAVGKIDNNCDQSQGLANLVVKNKAARFDPPNLAIVGADNAKLRKKFAVLLKERPFENCIKVRQILRVHKLSGISSRRLIGALRQAENVGAARG